MAWRQGLTGVKERGMCTTGSPGTWETSTSPPKIPARGVAVIQPRLVGGIVPLTDESKPEARSAVPTSEHKAKLVGMDDEESESPATCDEGEPSRWDPSEG